MGILIHIYLTNFLSVDNRKQSVKQSLFTKQFQMALTPVQTACQIMTEIYNQKLDTLSAMSLKVKLILKIENCYIKMVGSIGVTLVQHFNFKRSWIQRHFIAW